MSEIAPEKSALRRQISFGTRVLRYQLKNAAILSSVPILVIILLLAMLSVFVKLNIYYLEALGIPINDQLRFAYFDQVFNEVVYAGKYILELIAAVFIVSFILMRWAISPFVRAEKFTRKNVLEDDSWEEKQFAHFSEHPGFDQIVNQFVQACRTKTEMVIDSPIDQIPWNQRFFIKFMIAFGLLSYLSGKILSSVFFLAYERVVALSISLVPADKLVSHYFVAQQEILSDIVNFGVYVSIIIYFFLGRGISRYMAANIYIFSRAISEQKFPIILRKRDIYIRLADTLNKAYLVNRRGRI